MRPIRSFAQAERLRGRSLLVAAVVPALCGCLRFGYAGQSDSSAAGRDASMDDAGQTPTGGRSGAGGTAGRAATAGESAGGGAGAAAMSGRGGAAGDSNDGDDDDDDDDDRL